MQLDRQFFLNSPKVLASSYLPSAPRKSAGVTVGPIRWNRLTIRITVEMPEEHVFFARLPRKPSGLAVDLGWEANAARCRIHKNRPQQDKFFLFFSESRLELGNFAMEKIATLTFGPREIPFVPVETLLFETKPLEILSVLDDVGNNSPHKRQHSPGGGQINDVPRTVGVIRWSSRPIGLA
jgi:hypothetical protein